MNDELINWRKEIDSLDKELLKALSKRMEVVRKIGKLKKTKNLSALDEKRWKEVLNSKLALAEKLNLPKGLIKKIYTDIHEEALEIEKKLLPNKTNKKPFTFGIQGGKGSFNEQALHEYIKKNGIKKHKVKYLYTTEKVLKNLNDEKIDFGLFATHNSTGGIVAESIHAMANYKFKIAEELEILIRHFLMKKENISKSSLTTIMAHSQNFKQCKETLYKKHSNLKQVTGEGDLVDTAKAALYLSTGKISDNTAILGPKILSEIYGLEIIDEDLQDKKDNLTSFLLVKK